MNNEEFNYNYNHLKEFYEGNSSIKIHQIEKKQDQQNEPYYLMRETNLLFFKDEQHAKAMLNLKLFNILQPHEIITHQNQILIIMKDWRSYRLSENQLNKQNIEFILLQLAISKKFIYNLALNELSQKKITWNLSSISQLYLIEDCVFIQLFDLEDSHFKLHIPNIDIFKSFVRKYVPQLIQILDINMDNFDKIINYLLSFVKGLRINQQNHFGLNLFFKIMQISSSYGMEDIYTVEFNTPKVFETVFGIESKSILYRSYDLSKPNRNQQLEYQNREIFVTEKLSKTSNILINFSYLRLFSQTFFFQKKFFMTLAEAAEQNKAKNIDNIAYRKIAYRAINELSKGISIFHKAGIMHRNISPQSIYIDNENLVYAHFYIGDQGKAKEESLTNLGTQQSSSYQFHAPEGMQDITMKSDIYQFGLVALLLLNKGTPLFSFCFLDAEEIEKKFNPDYINNILIKNKLEYDKKLIEIIVQCLKQNPKDRPETVEIEKKVSSIYRNQRIRIRDERLEMTQNSNYNNDLSNQISLQCIIKMTSVYFDQDIQSQQKSQIHIYNIIINIVKWVVHHLRRKQ